MHCDVYKFARHPDLYLYIARPDFPNDTDALKDWFGVLPSSLRQHLGVGQFVLHVDLSTRQKLPRVDIEEVKTALAEKGYFVQMPPPDVLTRTALNQLRRDQDQRTD